MRERINVDYAIVSAFERSKRAGEKPASSHAFGIALFAVFFVIMMGCLAAGANIYSSVSGLHAQADDGAELTMRYVAPAAEGNRLPPRHRRPARRPPPWTWT